MPLPLGSIIISAVGATVAAVYQKSAAKRQVERDLKASELETAWRVFGEISVAVNSLAHLGTEAGYSVLVRGADAAEDRGEPRAADKQALSQYRRAWHDWMANRSRYLAEITRTFGSGLGESFEEIQARLAKRNSQLNATYFERSDHKDYLRSKEGAPEFGRFFSVRDEVEKQMERMIQEMLALIAAEEVGELASRRP